MTSTSHAQRPRLALPPQPRQRRGLWALPPLLSLLFVLGVIAWAQRNDGEEREELRRTMISDALSIEAQLRARVETEAVHLRALADNLRRTEADPGRLISDPQVAAGLRRLWLSVVWLDEKNRILAQVPEEFPLPTVAPRSFEDDAGLTSHLFAPLGDSPAAGGLVVRYSPAVLLKRGVPWWLARKYDVQLVDGSDLVIASTGDVPSRAAGDSYRVSFGPMPDAYLQLTQRDAQPAWFRTLPVVLMGGFLVLIAMATALLRRQVNKVSRAEAAWRTEAAWLAAMEDSVLVGLRARDADGRILYVNRTFCDMVGYRSEELLGIPPPMPYWPPDSIDESMQRMRRNLAGHAPREGYEARWRHRDGRLLDVMVFESPLVDAQGAQIGWMGSVIDITRRKRFEERERLQIDTLAHHARLTMLGEVASTLAHELNQPLTAIASYNAGAINSVRKHATPDTVVIGALERLGEQAAHAGRIVQRIREFLTRRAPRREACELNRVVRDAVALLQRELQQRHIELVLELDPELPMVTADPVLIEQVVINLVRNAADELSARDGERRIRLVTRPAAGQFVRLDVIDTGPGLSGRSIEALCAPFYSTKSDGMGMGLAICRSIIEAHNGAFDASDVAGGGACFSLSLPFGGTAQGSAAR